LIVCWASPPPAATCVAIWLIVCETGALGAFASAICVATWLIVCCDAAAAGVASAVFCICGKIEIPVINTADRIRTAAMVALFFA
jgi:hypothetical protein